MGQRRMLQQTTGTSKPAGSTSTTPTTGTTQGTSVKPAAGVASGTKQTTARPTASRATTYREPTPQIWGDDWWETGAPPGVWGTAPAYRRPAVAEYEQFRTVPEVERRIGYVDVPEVERRTNYATVYDYETIQRAEVVPEREYRSVYETIDVPEFVQRREYVPEYVVQPYF